MPIIEFFILTDTPLTDIMRATCDLIEKNYQQKHKLYIHTQEAEDAEYLNQLLWSFKETSFIPHGLADDSFSHPLPVQIGHQTPPENQRDILINLSHDVPDFFRQFNQVMEIISADTAHQEAGRARYRFYRDLGFNLTTHKLKRF